MQVQLFKKVGKYTDKDTGKEKPFTNFYVKCGDALIPVEPCYFPKAEFDNRDPNYNGRKQVLSAFAAILPDKNDGNVEQVHKPATPPSDDLTPVDDTEGALNGF